MAKWTAAFRFRGRGPAQTVDEDHARAVKSQTRAGLDSDLGGFGVRHCSEAFGELVVVERSRRMCLSARLSKGTSSGVTWSSARIRSSSPAASSSLAAGRVGGGASGRRWP